MKKRLVVMNGIHSSGKTTLGRIVAARLGGTFYPEIGGELRKQTSDNALQSGESFDREVMQRELGRDDEVLFSQNLPIVETWHFGNLAYARLRSPRVYEEYLEFLSKQLQRFEPVLVLCEIEQETFMARATENVPVGEMGLLYDFYRGIRQETLSLYARFGFRHISIQNDDRLDNSVEKLDAAISSGSPYL